MRAEPELGASALAAATASELLAAPGASTVGKRVLAWARVQPHAVAIESVDRAWTYGELAASVERLVEAMPRFDAMPVLAIHGAPSFGFISALIATMASGAIAMPIDAGLPLLRKRQMLELTRAGGVIDLEPLGTEPLGTEPLDTRRVWRLDRASAQPLSPGFEPIEAGLTRNGYGDAAYVFLTSGTTGTPKAVLGRASSLDHFVGWQRQTFAVGPSDRVGQFTSLSFDPCLREIFVALSSGARLQLPPSGARSSGELMRHFMATAGTTIAHTVPTLARHWLRDWDAPLDTLRLTIFAGEPLLADMVRSWRGAAPRSEIVNFYGPTETTLARFYWRVPEQPALVATPDPLPVGWPIDATRAVLVGANAQELPDGTVGEVLIDTAFPSYGYLDAVATEEKFVNLPGITARYGQRLYRSGDLGYKNAQGELVVVGRNDNQLKIGGVRINPNEVAAHVRAAPGIRDALVLAKHDRDGARLVAWYLPAGVETTSASSLRGYLTERLVPAMIPSQLVPLSAFPVTMNGKVDTAELLRSLTEAAPGAEAECPSTPSERLVCEAWARVFDVTNVALDEDFYARGGDSLKATELAGRLARSTSLSLDARSVFEHSTPRKLAAALAHGTFPRSASSTRRATTRDRLVTQISPRQRAYHAICMNHEATTWCILSRVVRLERRVEMLQLREALDALLRKHDSLRMRFPDLDHEGSLEILTPAQCAGSDVPVENLFPPDDFASSHERTAALRADGSAREIDPSRWPLLRLAHLRFADRDALILWVHHLIIDGPSLNLLVDELLAQLNGATLVRGEGAAEGYVDYLERCVLLQPAQLADGQAYWRRLLRGVRPTVLAEQRGRHDAAQGMLFTQAFPAALIKGVSAYARARACTPFIVLLGAFLSAATEHVGRTDLSAIVPVQLRPYEFTQTIGMFASSLVVRIDTSTIVPKCDDWTARLTSQILDGQRYSEYEFDRRLDDLGIPAQQYDFPLTTLLFNLNAVSNAQGFAAATPLGHHSLGRHLRFQLQAEVQKMGDELMISYLYRAGVFDCAEIERFAESVERKTAALIAGHGEVC